MTVPRGVAPIYYGTTLEVLYEFTIFYLCTYFINAAAAEVSTFLLIGFDNGGLHAIQAKERPSTD